MLRALLASHAFVALLLIAGCQSQPGSMTLENPPAAVPSATVTVAAVPAPAVPAPAAPAPVDPAPTAPETTDPYAELNADRIASLDDGLAEPKTPNRVSMKFPNIDLIDHNGNAVKFYDDLVQDQMVIINYFFTQCKGSCPGTTRSLQKLRSDFPREFAGKLRIISLSLSPEEDSPVQLREYMQARGIEDDPELCKWTFATGTWPDLDRLRRALGLTESDPVLDADRTQHAAIVTFGNDRTNRWAALPIGSEYGDVKQTIIRIVGDTHRVRYSDAVILGKTAHGHLPSTRSAP